MEEAKTQDPHQPRESVPLSNTSCGKIRQPQGSLITAKAGTGREAASRESLSYFLPTCSTSKFENPVMFRAGMLPGLGDGTRTPTGISDIFRHSLWEIVLVGLLSRNWIGRPLGVADSRLGQPQWANFPRTFRALVGRFFWTAGPPHDSAVEGFSVMPAVQKLRNKTVSRLL